MLSRWHREPGIPLIEVVDSFDVWMLGHQTGARAIRPSELELHSEFGTSNIDAVIRVTGYVLFTFTHALAVHFGKRHGSRFRIS